MPAVPICFLFMPAVPFCFQGQLEGSQQHAKLLEDANRFFQSQLVDPQTV
jgi:hypothetical protein